MANHKKEQHPLYAPFEWTELTCPVFFVGFMGAGKTSVARYLAKKCDIPTVDMDKYIEQRENKRISDIFAEVGEEGFRRIESDVLYELAWNEDPQLISCGGGIVVEEKNRNVLTDSGFVIYLKISVDEAAKRISDMSSRPLFQDMEAARKLCEERIPLYESVAELVVDTAGRSVSAIASSIRTKLERRGILCRQQKLW